MRSTSSPRCRPPEGESPHAAGRREIVSAGRLAFVPCASWLLLLLGATWAGCGGHAHATSRRVVMLAHSYDPRALSVAAGDTVEWVDHDLVPHTATARNGRWDSGVLAPEQFVTEVRDTAAAALAAYGADAAA